eukprot:5801834-Amphidinium_carterae.2
MEELCQLARSGHFGERSILRDEQASDFNVDAGPEGSTVTQWAQISTPLSSSVDQDSHLDTSRASIIILKRV